MRELSGPNVDKVNIRAYVDADNIFAGEFMLPLIIVVSAFTVLRTAGSLGVRGLTSWRTCLRWSLALMFLVTASGHWGSRRADLVAMVPPMFPSPGLLVTLTGILEIA